MKIAIGADHEGLNLELKGASLSVEAANEIKKGFMKNESRGNTHGQ